MNKSPISRSLFLSSLALTLAACGNVQIKPTSSTDGIPAAAFKSKNNPGYFVFEPRVLVNVSAVRTCTKPGEGNSCQPDGFAVTGCSVGAPYYVPNYARPYAVRVKPGLGSYSGAITIANGWMLSSLEASGDTTPFLSALTGAEAQGQFCDEGIYELERSTGAFKRIWQP